MPRATRTTTSTSGRTARFTRLSSAYVEALQNIELLRAFGAAERQAARFAREADGLADCTMRQLRLSLVDPALGALAMQLGTVLGSLAAGPAGPLGTAPAVMVLLLARECFRPVQDLGTYWHAGYLGLTAVDGLDRLVGAQPMGEGRHNQPATTGSIEVQGVSYLYPGASTGLAGCTFHVAPGQTLAMIGPSGSGKSTLARLLERYIDPDAGTIRIGGTDLRDFTAPVRARSVVVLPQDPVLFAWTVAENLRLYRPEASNAELEAAARTARTARIDEAITALP